MGKLNARYGVYFAYGNHDEGYFHYRNFTGDELRDEVAERLGFEINFNEGVNRVEERE